MPLEKLRIEPTTCLPGNLTALSTLEDKEIS